MNTALLTIDDFASRNTPALVEYFAEGTPDDQLLGFMTAPWGPTQEHNWTKIKDSLVLMGEAVKKHGII